MTEINTDCTQQHNGHTEGRPVTAVWHYGGFSALYDSFIVGSSVVFRLNFCAKNPPLRQAANRCRQCHFKSKHFINDYFSFEI